jgi:3-dehydroquinate synthase
VRQLTIDLGKRSYPIFIGEDLVTRSELFERTLEGRNVLIVTNDTVRALHFDRLQRGLGRRDLPMLSLPDGERFKTLATVERVFDALTAARVNRDGVVVAFGGGVVGDTAGFAAACYQRGIDYLQVPTTLLAQVDSAVGGKTGVNHPAGKNLIGAFHQPCAVVSDTATLRTLPARELRAGLAEVIKYGLIADGAFLARLERDFDALLRGEGTALMEVIARSCEIKAEIVAGDEREQGARALLNFGHTFGHAIEAATGFQEWLHGEAVGTGMLIAAAFSQRLGLITPADVSRVRALLERARLPTAAPRIGRARALELMQLDKKVRGGRIRFVVLDRIGSASVTRDYDERELAATLEEHFGS